MTDERDRMPGSAPAGDPLAAQPPVELLDDRSLSDLLSRLTNDLTSLLRGEMELAKAEIRQEAKQAGTAAGKLAAGAVVGLVAALLLSWALAFGIGALLTTWAGFAIVGALYAVIAAVLASNGRKQMQQVNPTPEQTIDSLKRDKQMLEQR